MGRRSQAERAIAHDAAVAVGLALVLGIGRVLCQRDREERRRADLRARYSMTWGLDLDALGEARRG